MKVTCYRLPANKPGPEIVDPLLTTDQAGIARGTREIDYYSTNRSIENGNCPLLPFMPTGSTINVTEMFGGYRGKLGSYALTVDISEDGSEFSAVTSITIEKEM